MALEDEISLLVAASNELTGVVSAKVGEIDSKVLEAQSKFDQLHASEFPEKVENALYLSVHIDPDNGDDGLDGLSENKAIKSSARLSSLVTAAKCHYLSVYIKSGTTFLLGHRVSVPERINFYSYGSGSGPTILRQSLSAYATLSSLRVHFASVNVYTYKAAENEVISQPIYQSRALFSGVKYVSFNGGGCYVCDNQLFHYHNAGSGDVFFPIIMSFYNAKISSMPSSVGVSGAAKKVFSFFSSSSPYPVDLFCTLTAFELNEVHATVLDFLGCQSGNLRSNVALT